MSFLGGQQFLRTLAFKDLPNLDTHAVQGTQQLIVRLQLLLVEKFHHRGDGPTNMYGEAECTVQAQLLTKISAWEIRVGSDIFNPYRLTGFPDPAGEPNAFGKICLLGGLL